MGLFESREERERKLRRQEDQHRAEEETRRKQREEEERRLAAKQDLVLPLVARARAQEYFLDPKYCERYAYEHRDEVLLHMTPEIPEYEQWLMDKDFTQGRLCEPRDAKLAAGVWNAKKSLVELAGGLSTADLRSWQLKEFKEFEAAAELRMSVPEYREREEFLPQALGELRQRFDKSIVMVFEGDDESRRMARDLMAKEQGCSSWEELEQKANQGKAPGAKEKTPLEMINEQPWMAIAMIGAVLDQVLIARISGRGVENAGKMEAFQICVGMGASREHKIFATDQDFADSLVLLDRGLHDSGRSRIDEVVQYYEKNYPSGFSKWKITAPWREWGEEWKERLGRPRTREQFLARMEESKAVVKDLMKEVETLKAEQEKGKADGK